MELLSRCVVFGRENLIVYVAVGILTCMILFIFKVVFHVVRLKRIYKGFPEAIEDRHWFLGHIPVFMDDTVGPAQLQKLQEYANTFPKLFIFWLTTFQLVVILHHPDTIKTLLKRADPKPVGIGQGYRYGIPWLGEGLLIAGGSKWARSRRLLTPAFHFDILKPYIAIYKHCADILADNIERDTRSGESVDVFNLVSLCTLDVILRCAFSYHTDCQSNRKEKHPYVQAVNELSATWNRRIRYPWLFLDCIFYLTKEGRQFSKNCDFVHKIAEDVIENRKRALETTDLTNRRYLDFMDILLTARDTDGQCMTKEDIRAEVDTFLFEGHDTTASAISWILYSLAEYPEYQNQCRQEIENVLNESKSQQVEWYHLGKLEFLTQCIKEGMRLHSPVPNIARVNTNDINLEGYEIPAGSMIGIDIYLLHHNPVVWGDDHMEFKPERFTAENQANRDSFAFCPFSAGPRNCIGQNFAMNEEKIILATLLQRFEFSLDQNHKPEKMVAAVMRAKNGIRLHAKCRC